MYEWRSDFDASRKLLCVAEHTDFAVGTVTGSGVFYQDDERFAQGGTLTVGADKIWHMTEHNDLIWGAGGADTDSFWHLDPSNVANAPTALAIPCSAGAAYPQYVISWRNYLLANGLRGNTVADCNVLSALILLWRQAGRWGIPLASMPSATISRPALVRIATMRATISSSLGTRSCKQWC